MFNEIVKTLDENMYHEFKMALVKGRWRSGAKLTKRQRKICEEVVYIRESYHFQQPETEHILRDETELFYGYQVFTVNQLQ